MPCDVENTCHRNANCEWVESELRYKCVCNPGFEGDGYECIEREISCLFVRTSPGNQNQNGFYLHSKKHGI